MQPASYCSSLAACLALFLLLFIVTPELGSCQSTNIPSTCNPHKPSPALEKFVDSLPIPTAINIVSGGSSITLGAYKSKQKLHRDLPETIVYGYGKTQATATYPGPTLESLQGIEAHVSWENHITDKDHIFVVDRTLHWANPRSGGVPIVTHLHGGEVESFSDGHPDAWYTASGERGIAFQTQNHTYPNLQEPTMLWYHDHTVGITRLNVFAGLLGLYFIRSAADEEKLKLPTGGYEVPLVIQDKQFDANGTMEFPTSGDIPTLHPSWCPEFYGDTILVNGKVWPYLNVEARLYRLRILNAANSRFFTLSLSDPSIPFVQIGTDGGYLPKPRFNLTKITLAPAERVDILVDFSSLTPGSELYLNNSAAAPFPVGFSVFDDNVNTKVIMKFIVAAGNSSTTGNTIPKSLPGRLRKIEHKNALVRNLTLLQINNANGSSEQELLNNMRWVDPVTETPKEGAVEVWRIINLTDKSHVIHVHLIKFRVLDQQAFNGSRYSAGNCSLDASYNDQKRSCYTDKRAKPDVNQLGWKDSVAVSPGVVTRLLMSFTTSDGKAFSFDATSEPGYLWHCHMVDHEDNDMMRAMKIQRA